VAKGSAARIPPKGDETVDGDQKDGTAMTRSRKRSPAVKGNPIEFDRLIHERVRLAIVSALAGSDVLTFNELRDLLDVTDGNLSVHARRLEEAGLIRCEKSFVDRLPRTEFRLTREGRGALDNYLNHMDALIRQVRAR